MLTRNIAGPVAALALAALLPACAGIFGGDSPQAVSSVSKREPSAARSCAEASPLFENFLARATSVTWTAAAKQASRLTIALSVENTEPLPAALTNSGSGILYTLDYALTNAAGKSFGPAEATGALTGASVHTMVVAGTPATGTLAFAVPRGDYTLTIARKLSGQAPPVMPKNEPLACRVVVSPPARAGAKTPPAAKP